MAHKLQIACLTYGNSRLPVKPTDILPLPEVFDFDHPEDCARHIFAVMSNASGGHTLRDCKLRFHRDRGMANLTSSGCHVFYHDDEMPKLEPDDIAEYVAEYVAATTQPVYLGDVTTDQYGEGWARARWTTSHNQE